MSFGFTKIEQDECFESHNIIVEKLPEKKVFYYSNVDVS